MGASQVLIKIALFLASHQAEDETSGSKKIMKNFCFTMYAGLLMTSVPLLYLFMQENSPFRTKSFEVVLTVYSWFYELFGIPAFQYLLNIKPQEQENEVVEAETNQQEHTDSLNEQENEDVEAEINQHEDTDISDTTTDDDGEISRFGRQAFIVLFAYSAFLSYLFVLSVLYWISDDIDSKYDKVFCMMTIVSVPVIVFDCFCLCGLSWLKALNASDSGEEKEGASH